MPPPRPASRTRSPASSPASSSSAPAARRKRREPPPRPPPRPPPPPHARAVTPEERVERRISEIQFDAAPEVVTEILADLERAPEVSAVSRVEMRRADREGASRQLHATIAAETWVVARKGRAR